MDEDEIESELSRIVEGTDHDMSWAWETYRKHLNELEDRNDGLTEDQIQLHATRMVESEIHHASRTSYGEIQEVNILAIGHSGIQQWKKDTPDERDVLIGLGLVQPPNDEDGNPRPRNIGVFVCDESEGADIGNCRSAFSKSLNMLKGWFTIRESDELKNDGVPVYVCRSDEETRVEEVDADVSEEERREMIREYVPEANIANIHQHLTQTNDDGFPVAQGGDIRRLNATVIDWNKGDGYNTYTLLDDSVVDPEELGEDIINERARSPGLTAWVPSDFHNWGLNSQLEVYGTLNRNNEGQINMNVCGIIPLIPMEMNVDDEEETESRSETTESSI